MEFRRRVSRVVSHFAIAPVRMSAFAVASPDFRGDALCEIVRRELGKTCEVGLIDPDTVGLLYYGPRPGGGEADQRVACDIRERLRAALGDRGQLGLRVLHQSSGHVTDAQEVIAALQRAPARFLELRGQDMAA